MKEHYQNENQVLQCSCVRMSSYVLNFKTFLEFQDVEIPSIEDDICDLWPSPSPYVATSIVNVYHKDFLGDEPEPPSCKTFTRTWLANILHEYIIDGKIEDCLRWIKSVHKQCGS